ncbi:MAG: hypothetical protein LBN03_01335 [Bifidobacteriaceae bacterium]|jgi:hypothetical protein|nr:hypothetical protein [Bifidobacteriaceae bacterium]
MKFNFTSQKGSAIVEATFIFPFCIACLIFCIFFNDYFYARSMQYSSIKKSAIQLAKSYQDKRLDNLQYDSNGAAYYPTTWDNDNGIMPAFRFLGDISIMVGSVSDESWDYGCDSTDPKQATVRNKLDTDIRNSSLLGVSITPESTVVSYCPGIFYSTIRTFSNTRQGVPFMETFIKVPTLYMKNSIYTEETINKNTDFQRDINMVGDLLGKVVTQPTVTGTRYLGNLSKAANAFTIAYCAVIGSDKCD